LLADEDRTWREGRRGVVAYGLASRRGKLYRYLGKLCERGAPPLRPRNSVTITLQNGPGNAFGARFACSPGDQRRGGGVTASEGRQGRPWRAFLAVKRGMVRQGVPIRFVPSI